MLKVLGLRHDIRLGLTFVCLVLCGSTLNAGHWTDQTRLIAHWPLNDNGSHAVDTFGGVSGRFHGHVGKLQPGAIRGSADTCISLNGNDAVVVIPHADAFRISAGTVSLLFDARDLKPRQGLFSSDANGNGQGGHLTIWIEDHRIAARIQSKKKSYILESAKVGSGWRHVAVSFGRKGFSLAVDGHTDARHKFDGGLKENREPIVLGANAIHSSDGESDKLSDFFHGQLDEVLLFGEQLDDEHIHALARSSLHEYAVPALRNFTNVDAAYSALRPVAWWPLKQSDDQSVAADRTGKHHGKVSGTVSPFNGRDEHVDVGGLDLGGKEMTILAWISPYNFKVGDARILSKATGTNVNDHFWMLSTVNDHGKHRLRFRLRANGRTKELIGDAGTLHVEQRVLATAVYDGVQLRLYQNGKLVGRTHHSGAIDVNSQVPAWIGDNPSGSGSRPFAGSIQDVAMFDHALSVADIRSIVRASQQRSLSIANSGDAKTSGPAQKTPRSSLPSPRTIQSQFAQPVGRFRMLIVPRGVSCCSP